MWPGDLVIKHLTFQINRAMYSAKMHLCMKFCESMSNIHGKNVTISFKHEYRRHTLTSRYDVISDVMNIKKHFLCNNLWCSFHIFWQNEHISNFSKFSKWPPFWFSSEFFNLKLYRKLSLTARYAMPFPTFWDFVRRSNSNIKGVMASSIFDLLFDLVT